MCCNCEKLVKYNSLKKRMEIFERHRFSQKRKPRTLELSSILDSQPTAEDGT